MCRGCACCVLMGKTRRYLQAAAPAGGVLGGAKGKDKVPQTEELGCEAVHPQDTAGSALGWSRHVKGRLTCQRTAEGCAPLPCFLVHNFLSFCVPALMFQLLVYGPATAT